MAERFNYRILEAYKDKGLSKFMAKVGIFGLAGLVTSTFFENTNLAIGSSTLVGASTFVESMNYVNAYMEAKLDFLNNEKFAKFED